MDPVTGMVSGTISFEAAAGSPYSSIYQATDDGSPPLSAGGIIEWTVASVDRPPGFDGELPDRTDAEGAAVSLAVPATDPDGDPLIWQAAGLPPGLAIDPATGLISGTISYEAAPGSPYAVLVRVEDPGGLIDTDTFTWTVTETNRAPWLDPGLGNRTDVEGAAIWLPAPASDPDGDPLSWSASGLPPGLDIDPGTRKDERRVG